MLLKTGKLESLFSILRKKHFMLNIPVYKPFLCDLEEKYVNECIKVIGYLLKVSLFQSSKKVSQIT